MHKGIILVYSSNNVYMCINDMYSRQKLQYVREKERTRWWKIMFYTGRVNQSILLEAYYMSLLCVFVQVPSVVVHNEFIIARVSLFGRALTLNKFQTINLSVHLYDLLQAKKIKQKVGKCRFIVLIRLSLNYYYYWLFHAKRTILIYPSDQFFSNLYQVSDELLKD